MIFHGHRNEIVSKNRTAVPWLPSKLIQTLQLHVHPMAPSYAAGSVVGHIVTSLPWSGSYGGATGGETTSRTMCVANLNNKMCVFSNRHCTSKIFKIVFGCFWSEGVVAMCFESLPQCTMLLLAAAEFCHFGAVRGCRPLSRDRLNRKATAWSQRTCRESSAVTPIQPPIISSKARMRNIFCVNRNGARPFGGGLPPPTTSRKIVRGWWPMA